MVKNNTMRLSVLIATSALVFLCAPDVIFARGGGGGGGGRGGGTMRTGPAARGSVGRDRTRASGRGDIIRDGETGGDQRRSSADSRAERAAEREANRPGTKPKPVPKARWGRAVGGRVYTVAEFRDLSCGRVERVDGVSYFNCDGAWFEKVFESGEVRWVEVTNPN